MASQIENDLFYIKGIPDLYSYILEKLKEDEDRKREEVYEVSLNVACDNTIPYWVYCPN